MSLRLLILIALFVCTPTFVLAQEEEVKPHDAEGCKDSPLFGRMPGSLIAECSDKEFDEAEMPAGRTGDEIVSKKFEGAITRLNYVHKKGQAALQIARNYENALKKIGFKTIYNSDENGGTLRTITAKKEGKGATVVRVEADGYNADQPTSNVTIVKLKEMEQEIAADANALLDELNRSGHVAVYGINFDSGKAEVKPESAAVLGEVVKLLQQNPELKLRIEGHTDNVGKGNLELSKKRAAAVKEWLGKNGVPAARLATDGFGDKKPVADNATDEGRAKNRRVELVKI